MRKQTQQLGASHARRDRLEEPFGALSVGGAMRCYQTGDQAVVAPPAPAASQPVGQVGSPQVSPGAAPQAAPGMVQLPANLFEGLSIDPKDFGNVRHRLKEYDRLNREGWLNLAEQARANKLGGNQLAAHLEGAGWSLEQPQGQPEPPAGQVAWPSQQPQYAQPGQPGYGGQGVDPNTGLPYGYLQEMYPQNQVSLPPEFQQLLAQQQEAMQALRKQVQDLTGQYESDRKQQTEAEKRQAREAAFSLEDQAVREHLEGLGYKRNPTKQTFLGQEQEVDLLYDVFLDPAMRQLAHMAYSPTVVPGEDGSDDKLKGAIPPEFVKAATEAFGPLLTLIQQKGAQVVSDKQAPLPLGALPGGPGGREQKQPSEMTRKEIADEVIRQADAEGARLRGNYGE